jgi:uncharacterized protein (DUF1778 family)
MARPKKPPADLKAVVVRMRVTEEEHRLFKQAAEHERFDLSTWLRRIAWKEANRIKSRQK